ncbi:MAG: ribose 5-phosphate isomerase B [Candidatus Adiutrix sp.]|jgi:ribose 5-phosphate isomerase B|nr:ribose 5-phosphate isomerase B [Candidatus Adiutrix sp.]
MKIVLASDHAGRDYRKIIRDRLAAQGFSLTDLGVADGLERADYPEYARQAAAAVVGGAADRGILICGTGTGMAMAANKVKGVRAANCTCEIMARLARSHNDANILTLGARILGLELAQAIVAAFLTTGFDGGRHQERLDKLESGR